MNPEVRKSHRRKREFLLQAAMTCTRWLKHGTRFAVSMGRYQTGGAELHDFLCADIDLIGHDEFSGDTVIESVRKEYASDYESEENNKTQARQVRAKFLMLLTSFAFSSAP